MMNDDCLVIAGDSLITSSLRPKVKMLKKSCAVVELLDIDDQQFAKQYSMVAVNSDGKTIDSLEKPSDPIRF